MFDPRYEKTLQDLGPFIAFRDTDAILIGTPSGEVIFVNAMAAHALGLTLEECLGKKFSQLVDKEVAAIVKEKAVEAAKTHEPVSFMLEGESAGKHQAFEFTFISLSTEKGDPADAIFCKGRDVTELVIANRLRAEGEERLRKIIEELPYPIEVCDAGGTAIIANQGLLDMFGLASIDQVVGKYNVFEDPIIINGGLLDEVKSVYDGNVVENKMIEIAMENVVSSYGGHRGGVIYLESKMAPIHDERGKLWGVVTAFHDITERVIMQNKLRESLDAAKRLTHSTVRSLTRVIELRDPYTAGHQMRVSELACAIAEDLNLKPDIIEEMRVAGLVHDIGKILLPSEILSKPGALSDFEYAIVRKHPEAGGQVLNESDFDQTIINIVEQHHERMDGSGYPLGLIGEEISLEARILRCGGRS